MRRDEQPDDGVAREGWVTRREGPGGKVIVLLLALVLLVVFVLQNTEEIRIDFLFWHGRWPAWIVILLVAALGLLVGWIAATVRGRRRRERPPMP
jgi:uncharacterized integral membrane protein